MSSTTSVCWLLFCLLSFMACRPERPASSHLLLSSSVSSSSPVRKRRRLSTFLSLTYDDCGDCSLICQFCGALFWYAERVLATSTVNQPCYNHCVSRVLLFSLFLSHLLMCWQAYIMFLLLGKTLGLTIVCSQWRHLEVRLTRTLTKVLVRMFSRFLVRSVTGLVPFALKIINVLGFYNYTSLIHRMKCLTGCLPLMTHQNPR